MTQEKPTRTPENFDPKTLKISEEATKDFYSHGHEHGSNPIKIAFDAKGKKVLLKTSTFFKPDDQKNEDAVVSLDAFRENMVGSDFDEELELYRELSFSEERVYNFARLIGLPMAETKYVDHEGIPFVAYQFLEGAIDRHVGNRLDISDDVKKREKQETTLALSGLLKVWFSAGDGGQFLQTENGDIFLSDFSAHYARELDLDALTHQLRSNYDLSRDRRILTHQIAGMHSKAFSDALDTLEKLSEKEMLQFVSRETKKPTNDERELARVFLQRLTILVPFFRSLSRDEAALEKMSKILLK